MPAPEARGMCDDDHDGDHDHDNDPHEIALPNRLL
jgi:hypothetical protein